jgi:hypothetical protein
MNFFDNWKPIWRWLFFIPSFFITYLLLYFLNMISLSRFIGPYDESSFFSFIFYRFYLDTISIGASVIVSSLCVPKGRIVIASIYLGIMLLLFGSSLPIILSNSSYYPTWKLVYSLLTTLTGGIGALILVIAHVKEQKEKDLKLSSENEHWSM